MSILTSIRSQLSPIHPEGYPFIGGLAAASLILFFVWPPLGWLGTLLTAWCAYFFRDPVRVTPWGTILFGLEFSGLLFRRFGRAGIQARPEHGIILAGRAAVA